MNNNQVGLQPGSSSGEDAFRARMEEQCRQIRRYRLQVMQAEHRWLTVEEAAREWIERYARDYARDYSGDYSGDYARENGEAGT